MTIHPEDGAIKEKEYLEGYDARKRNLCTLEEARQRSGKFAQGWLAADVDETKRVFSGYGQVAPPPPPPPRPEANFGQPYPVGRNQYPVMRNGLGTAALVLGIIGFIIAVVPPLFWLAFPLTVLALVFGLIGAGRAKKGQADNLGQARAGWILGAIGLTLSTIFFSVVITAVDEAMDSVPTEEEIIEEWGEGLDDIQYDGYLDCIDSIPLDMSTSRFEQEMITCEDVWLGN